MRPAPQARQAYHHRLQSQTAGVNFGGIFNKKPSGGEGKIKMSFDNPSGEIEPTYKKFKHMTEDSVYTRAMKKPNKYCTDRELRIKYDMAADAGDYDNMRNIPIEKAYAHIGKSEYKPN